MQRSIQLHKTKVLIVSYKKPQQSNDIPSDILVQILLGNNHEYQILNNFHTLETKYYPPGDAEKETRPTSLTGYQLTGQQPHLPS